MIESIFMFWRIVFLAEKAWNMLFSIRRSLLKLHTPQTSPYSDIMCKYLAWKSLEILLLSLVITAAAKRWWECTENNEQLWVNVFFFIVVNARDTRLKMVENELTSNYFNSSVLKWKTKYAEHFFDEKVKFRCRIHRFMVILHLCIFTALDLALKLHNAKRKFCQSYQINFWNCIKLGANRLSNNLFGWHRKLVFWAINIFRYKFTSVMGEFFLPVSVIAIMNCCIRWHRVILPLPLQSFGFGGF